MPLDRNTDVVLANAIKGLHFVRDLSEPGVPRIYVVSDREIVLGSFRSAC